MYRGYMRHEQPREERTRRDPSSQQRGMTLYGSFPVYTRHRGRVVTEEQRRRDANAHMLRLPRAHREHQEQYILEEEPSTETLTETPYGMSIGTYAEEQRPPQCTDLEEDIATLRRDADRLTAECDLIGNYIEALPDWEEDAAFAQQKQLIMQHEAIRRISDSELRKIDPSLQQYRGTLESMVRALDRAKELAPSVKERMDRIRDSYAYRVLYDATEEQDNLDEYDVRDGEPVIYVDNSIASLYEIGELLQEKETLHHLLRYYVDPLPLPPY